MGVYKYTGKKGTVYFVDYYFKGKRFREQVGPNKKEAQEYLGKKLKEIRDGKFREAPVRPVPFEELADDYEKQAKAKKPRSGAAVNREMACLGAILNKAVKWELIPKNPASLVESYDEPAGRNTFLSVEEAGRLLEACSRHLRPIVLCALETGMRKAEILGLRWREIRNGQIYLAGGRTKNGKPREIPVSDTLAKELERLKSAYSEKRVVELSGLVFQAPRERKGFRRGVLQIVEGPMRDIRGAWETAKKKASIDPGFHFHDLRHTFASHQKMAGVDDFTLMEIMGHSDIRMMQRYAHLTPEHKRKAINSLPEWKSQEDGQKLVRNSGSSEKGLNSILPQVVEMAGV